MTDNVGAALFMKLRIWIKDSGSWAEVPNGPFPITQAQLSACRQDFQMELAASMPLDTAKQVPQTVAREILGVHCPTLSNFDRLMLGFAVTNPKIKVEEVLS